MKVYYGKNAKITINGSTFNLDGFETDSAEDVYYPEIDGRHGGTITVKVKIAPFFLTMMQFWAFYHLPRGYIWLN